MKKIYFTPVTKVMSLNVRNSFMDENAVNVTSEPAVPPTDEPAPAPMF